MPHKQQNHQSTCNRRSPTDQDRRFGLVIGINNHFKEAQDLHFASNDADAIYQLMLDQDCGRFEKKNVRLLLNENATRRNITTELSWLITDARADDIVWIYYAGHSIPHNDEYYWIPYDGSPENPLGTCLNTNDLQNFLNKIRAQRVVIFLDTCHAAASMNNQQGLKSRSVFTVDEFLKAYKGTGRITFASCMPNQRSVELPNHNHGAFTWCLLDGLRGAADKNKRGVVTAKALWEFLNERVEEVASKVGHNQTPVWTAISVAGKDIPLTVNSESIRRLADLHVLVDDTEVGVGENELGTEEKIWLLELIDRALHSTKTRYEEIILDALPFHLEQKDARIFGLKAMIFKARNDEKQTRVPTYNSYWKIAIAIFVILIMLAVTAPIFHIHGIAKERDDLDMKTAAQANQLKFIGQEKVALANQLAVAEQTRTAILEERDKAVANNTEYTTKLADEMSARAHAEQEIINCQKHVERLIHPPLCAAVNNIEPPMVSIPDRSYGIGKCLVTQTQWEAVMKSNPSNFNKGEEYPIENVSWHDVQKYIRQLNLKTNKKFRLPTAEELEHAARGNTNTLFWWGDEDPACIKNAKNGANFDDGKDCHNIGTVPTGSFTANPFGLYDVHGNVWQWTNTCKEGRCTVLGGSWFGTSKTLRAGFQRHESDNIKDSAIGFRLLQED